LIASHTGLAGVHTPTDVSVTTETLDPEYVSRKAFSKKKIVPSDMKDGYYMLDTNETVKRGVPKYIYVGPEAPHMIYHQMDASI